MSEHTTMPTDGFLRLAQIVGNPRSNPPQAGLIPISASSWWAGVADGRYPKPVKIGPRTTAWRASDIAELIKRLGSEG
jgi:predicted DNA-binding transcriptional regulator AlpA